MKSAPGSWSFTRWTTVDQLEALEIRHPDFRAQLFLQGAHLTHYAPTNESNWLWLSDTARFNTGSAIRGGIPICWPWFGDPDKNPAAVRRHIRDNTAHGFARTAVWSLEDVRESPDDVEVSLSLDATSDFSDLWEGHAKALVTFRFSATTLQMALTTTNLGPEPLTLSQALHSYFPTSDITRTAVTGLDNTRYTDTLEQWSRYVQHGDIHFSGEVDRIYETDSRDIGITTPASSYRLCSSGSQSAVAWNPGPEKAGRLSDFPAHAWQTMLCVETANAHDDVRELNNGQSHTLGVLISRLQEHKDSQ